MRILFLTHRLPYAPNRGDRIRAYYLMREMSTFADVSLFSLIHDDDEAARVTDVPFARRVAASRVTRLRNIVRGAAQLASPRPLTHALLDAAAAHREVAQLVAAAPPDVVVAYCSGMAKFAMDPTLAPYPLVVDLVDVDSQKWRQLAAETSGPRAWIYRREAATLAAFERLAATRAATTLVVNERERRALQEIAPDARACVIENGIELDAFRPPNPPGASRDVVFCGVLNYTPNEEGICWFAREVWPRVLAAEPAARFVIVGAGVTSTIRKIAAADVSVQVVGAVAAVQPYLWRAAVSVAPLRLGRGLQNKVLEALAAGLPVVVTPAVLDGLPQTARAGCRTAADPALFADALLDLLRSTPETRRREALRAELDDMTWSERLRPLKGIIAAAARTDPDRRA
jgi:sugar transferase (PEP-CTERM/EpsH1 system associated)